MRQNEIIFDLLNSKKSDSTVLNSYIEANPNYIENTTKFVLDYVKEEGKQELEPDIKALTDLEDALFNLYFEGTLTGFQTGIDLAMVLMGSEPVYNVLPESQTRKLDSRTKAIVSNLTELTNVAGYEKVARLIHSLGYDSVAELIVMTEK